MRELGFDIYGRRLAALSWGEPGETPVLALHGWLDNAASFIPLAENLRGVHLVAPDLPGHGQSDHRAADGEYNVWSDLPDIEALVDALGWERFTLLGHSRGGIVCCLYASARPERVGRLALLDSLLPTPADPAQCPQQLASFLSDKQRLLDRPGRVFSDAAEAVAVREKKGLSPQAAKLIAERNLKPVDGGWCWSHDARLQGASAIKLTEAHNRAVLAGLSMPGLLLLAEDGLRHRGDMPELPDTLEVKIVPGGHHAHMEESAGAVASALQDFLCDSGATAT